MPIWARWTHYFWSLLPEPNLISKVAFYFIKNGILVRLTLVTGEHSLDSCRLAFVFRMLWYPMGWVTRWGMWTIGVGACGGVCRGCCGCATWYGWIASIAFRLNRTLDASLLLLNNRAGRIIGRDILDTMGWEMKRNELDTQTRLLSDGPINKRTE